MMPSRLPLVTRTLLLWLLIATGAAGQTVPGAGAARVPPGRPAIPLTLKQAVEMALAPEGSARVQLADALARQAQTRSDQARAALLPNVDAHLSQQNRTLNLAANGIRINVPLPGFMFPTLVGPFNTFDVRASMGQSILDLSAIRRLQAARVGVNAAESESESARDQVAGQVARLYFSGLRADADLEAALANVDLSEALLKLATDQKAAGTGVGIEVTRARVQLANDRQRLLVVQNQRRQALLELRKAMGMKLDRELELVDKLAYMPVEALTLDKALALAYTTRADFSGQLRREEGARLTYDATKLERVPSVAGFADYGSIGSSINHAIPTRGYGLSLRLPIFDGGRRDARRAETLSQYQQERIRTYDLQQQVELDVRLALDGLASAEEQVKVAEEGLELSQSELEQARRRYQAGLVGSIEITDAQTRLARARDNRIAALYNQNLARINLGQAVGVIRQWLK